MKFARLIFLSIAACAVASIPLLPQRIVKFSACCLEPGGCMACQVVSRGSTPQFSERPECCKPLIVQIPSTRNLMADESLRVKPIEMSAVVVPASHANPIDLGIFFVDARPIDPAPPPDILVQQSRLNL
ncbi:MAG TPA: hypothetical protein VKX17_18440 [Planctomycetota bacterium]|nr:hypothetical protein [Planctomycetota bacterium]